MAVLNLIAFATFLLEDENLIVFQVSEDRCVYRGAFHNRCTYFDLTVVVLQQYFIEAHSGVFLSLQTVNVELPIFLNLKLLTCYFYYYVHLKI